MFSLSLRSFYKLATVTALLSTTTLIRAYGQSDNFNWNTLTPSRNLTWVECYSNATQCTNFQVPLNYSDPNAGSAVLALIRIPSPLANTPEYRGPIIVNPGGPGSSGVDEVLQLGELISSTVGPMFDVVGFDPRGVARSTPNISFFLSDTERALWDFSTDVKATPDAIQRMWADSQILGRLAQERDDGILKYCTSDKVAQDMLNIVEAHGQQNLQYWGISYGSVVGATFAAMFPDRVERLIIDGVLDMQGYYATDWSNEVLDTDKALQTFFDGCHAAGPEACAFYASSSDEIKQNLESLYNATNAQPTPAFPTELSPAYGLVDRTTLNNAVIAALYTPYQSFSALAQGLSDLKNGNGTTIFQQSRVSSNEVVVAVSCGDGSAVTDGPAELEKYYDSIKNISSFSNVIAGFRVQCSGWRIHPQHFSGPIVGNTSFPLLLIGNTADPVTPLPMAIKTSKAFPGSVVLTQDSPGHTSFSIPSECTLGHVQKYFQNGTMPQPGTICPTNGTLFPLASNN